MQRLISIAAVGAALIAHPAQAGDQPRATVYVFCTADYDINGRRSAMLSDVGRIPAAEFNESRVETGWKAFLSANHDISGASECHTADNERDLQEQMETITRANTMAGVTTTIDSYPPH